ncbi:MAG: hypothetical protein ACTHLX_01255, partial [Candidatus Binatia bacterium]
AGGSRSADRPGGNRRFQQSLRVLQLAGTSPGSKVLEVTGIVMMRGQKSPFVPLWQRGKEGDFAL